jgi:aspartyl-tRNA(Asn)/glutamyl-tRNA(Gln) amidotransferase subunit A
MTASYLNSLPPIGALREQLAAGKVSARELVETCLERVADPHGQGRAVYLRVDAERARREADAVDRHRAQGQPLPALAGIPLSVKDLFDVQGEVTTAGSTALREQPAARADAPAVERVRAAGAIAIGRTNMTEFAYSGLGLNPHYGTPLNPHERELQRIPGGSSSGAAIALTDGMAAASLGTDTGGSCRIPAALVGVVGFKPTASRVPLQGVIPLSPSLDSVGPLARTVEGCALLDAALAGGVPHSEPERTPAGLQLLVPTTLVLEELDADVARAFERALGALERAGARIVRAPLAPLARLPELYSRGGIAAAEAYAWHRELLEARGAQYDPRVAARIRKGRELSSSDHQELLRERARLIEELRPLSAPFDAVLLPSVPIIAPRLAELASDASYLALNALVLRNTSIANFADRCAISIPVQRSGEPPVGLMLMGEHGADRALLGIALGVERLLSPAL